MYHRLHFYLRIFSAKFTLPQGARGFFEDLFWCCVPDTRPESATERSNCARSSGTGKPSSGGSIDSTHTSGSSTIAILERLY
jgi:hypothetical protein